MVDKLAVPRPSSVFKLLCKLAIDWNAVNLLKQIVWLFLNNPLFLYCFCTKISRQCRWGIHFYVFYPSRNRWPHTWPYYWIECFCRNLRYSLCWVWTWDRRNRRDFFSFECSLDRKCETKTKIHNSLNKCLRNARDVHSSRLISC